MEPCFRYGAAALYRADCFEWLELREPNSVHGVVTDPPYALVEYTGRELRRKAKNKGVWRRPPRFDGYVRAPVPRFTVLSASDLSQISNFFEHLGELLLPVVVPGGHVLIASSPLVSHVVALGLTRAGFDHRGKVTRLHHTMRGGDRPKNAHVEFSEVSVIPKSLHEPWLLFRKPLDGTVSDNLRKWKTGGLRRPSIDEPFGDVIRAGRAERAERKLASHPSLKPQGFLRQVVRAILPLGEGVVLDPFCGSGSTLAAAEYVGYTSIGVERSAQWVRLATNAIPRLSHYELDAVPTSTVPVPRPALAHPT